MKSLTTILILGIFILSGFAADEKKQGIDADLLAELSASFTWDAHTRAIHNALSTQDSRAIAVNQRVMRSRDTHYSLELERRPITNQESTGRCWMYAGLNVLRPLAIKKLNTKDIQFSQTYLFFYDKLEKANLFLQGILDTRGLPLSDRKLEFLLRNPVPDGGQWVGMVELIRKYGVVPYEIMPDNYSSSHSSSVNRALAQKLREYALALRGDKSEPDLERIRVQALKDVYRILAVNFGVPPSEFTWRYKDKDDKLTAFKTWTPLDFYQQVVGAALDDYYALYSIPNRPFHRLFTILWDQAVADRPGLVFANIPLEELKQLTLKSLEARAPVWFGCDVGKDSLSKEGVMAPELFDLESLYGMPFRLSRDDAFNTWASAPTHAMVFTGVDLVDQAPTKWLVENSWGPDSCDKGYYHMADSWFDRHVQVVVIHKRFIPEKILNVFTQKPEILPPWDPMYRALMQ
ncbi:MAG: C1 family peptidase [Acidobacteriota bacterium]|jgi:bleomycin hydrolase|nr:C1 family peptidase [Acidobacteriota bacterium]